MTRAGNQRLPVFRGLAMLGLGVVWAMACGGPQKQAGAGAVCFRTDDCQTELACVPEAIGSSTRVCSADASGIVSMVDGAPLEAAAPMPDAAVGGAGGMQTPAGGSNAAGATGTPNGGSAGAASAGAPAKGGSGGAGTAGAPAKGGSGGTGAAGAPAKGGNGGGGSAGANAGNGGAPAGGSGGATAGSGGATAGSGG
jgi:hypothetical protein